MNKPPIVDAATWQQQRDELLLEEKRLTKELDALAAKRRRLPMSSSRTRTSSPRRAAR